MGKNLEQRATGGGGSREVDQRTIKQEIGDMEEQFRLAMPKGGEAIQLVRDLHTQLRTIKNLDRCDKQSVLGSAMTCAQLGLRPGVLGQAWLLPFYNNKTRSYNAQLVIGYQGYIELAYRSGRVSMLQSRAIYEKDHFELVWGADADTIIHKPAPFDQDPGEIVGYYAVGRTTAGGYVFTRPMSRAEMEKHRDKHAPKYEGRVIGPWKSDFDEMGLKTMARKLVKFLPKSTELAQAMVQDEGIRFDPRAEAVNEAPDYVDGEFSDGHASDDEGPGEPAATSTVATAAQRNAIKRIMVAEVVSDAESAEWLLAQTQGRASTLEALTADEAEAIKKVFA